MENELRVYASNESRSRDQRADSIVVGADDDLLEHASICIYDALKYHGPNRKIGPRAQFFYVFRNKKKVWFHTYTIVLLVNCLGSYLLEGVVFTTFPQASILAYILNFCCLGVYIADLVFQWLYTTRHSFWRRRWNRVQVVVISLILASTIVSVVLDACDMPQLYRRWAYAPARVLRPIILISHYRYVRKLYTGILATTLKIGYALLPLVVVIVISGTLFNLLFNGFNGLLVKFDGDGPGGDHYCQAVNLSGGSPCSCLHDFLFNNLSGISATSLSELQISDVTGTSSHLWCSTYNPAGTCTDYFRYISSSVLQLIILLSTANYPDVMLPAYHCSGWSAVFFIGYMTVAYMLVANVVLATVYESFSAQTGKIMKETNIIRKRKSYQAFELLMRLQDLMCTLPHRQPTLHSPSRRKVKFDANEDASEVDAKEVDAKDSEAAAETVVDTHAEQPERMLGAEVWEMLYDRVYKIQDLMTREVFSLCYKVVQALQHDLKLSASPLTEQTQVEPDILVEDGDTRPRSVAIARNTSDFSPFKPGESFPPSPESISPDEEAGENDGISEETFVHLVSLLDIKMGMKTVEKRPHHLCKVSACRRMRTVLETRAWQYFVQVLVLANMAVIVVYQNELAEAFACGHGEDPCLEETWADSCVPNCNRIGVLVLTQAIFTLVFSVDIAINLVAFGLQPFWKANLFNKIDIITTACALMSLVLSSIVFLIHREGEGGTTDLTLALSSLRQIFTLLRLLRVMRTLVLIGGKKMELRYMAMYKMFRDIGVMLIIIAFELYLFAVLGMELFGLPECGDIFDIHRPEYREALHHRNISIQGTAFQALGYWDNNFNTLPEAFVTMFEQMIVNNWPVVLEAQMGIAWNFHDSSASESTARMVAAVGFFIVFHVTNVYLISNVLTAFVLDLYASHLERLEVANDDNKQDKEETFVEQARRIVFESVDAANQQMERENESTFTSPSLRSKRKRSSMMVIKSRTSHWSTMSDNLL